MKPCPSHAIESSKIYNSFDKAGFPFKTRQPSLSHTCSIGFKSGNKLGRGRLAMFCRFLYYPMMRVHGGITMSSRSNMFWPFSESTGDLTPDSRISSWYVWAFKVQVTTFNCIRWSSDNAPRTICFSNNSLHSSINVDRFLCVILPLSLCSFRGLLSTLWATLNTLAMLSCFIPAFLTAILHIQSSFFFVDVSNIRVLRLFRDSTAKEIHFCISTPGQYCVVSFPFMDSCEWN